MAKQLYATLDATVEWRDHDNYKEGIQYYLYIGTNGKRTVEHISEKLCERNESWKTHPIYTKYIMPWLKGAKISYIDEHAVDISTMEPIVCIPKYTETTIDKWYNWYCNRKGRHMRTLTSEDLSKIFEI